MPPHPAAAQRRAVNYARVSAARGDYTSVDTQLAEGRKVATREGWDLVAEFRDDGISASRFARGKQRPGWQDVMGALSAELRPGDVLIVWELSRASRDRTVTAALFAACAENRVLLCVGGKLHDPNDADDGFVLDLGAALAVRESNMTSQRVKREVNARTEHGKPHGRVAYGYRRTYDPWSGRPAGQEPDPDTAPVVREIARRLLAGESLRAVTIDLNDRHVPSPWDVIQTRNPKAEGPIETRPWRPQQVRRIATSATAAGMRLAGGHIRADVTCQWQPLISREDHYRLVALLAERSRDVTGDNAVRHLLTHIATCSRCDAGLLARRNNTTPSYSCPDGHVSRSRAQLDAMITRLVLGWLVNPVAARAMFTRDVAERRVIEQAADDVADARAALERLYDELSERLADGSFSQTGFDAVERRLRDRLARAEQRALPSPASPALRELLSGGDVRTLWRSAAITTQREAVRGLMVIRVHPTERGRRVLDPHTIEVTWREW